MVIKTKDYGFCKVNNQGMETKYFERDDPNSAIVSDLKLSKRIALGISFKGYSLMSDEDCYGFLPFEGDWEETAAQIWTVKDFSVIDYDKKAKQVILDNWMDNDNEEEDDDVLRVDLPEDKKRAKKIHKKLMRCEVTDAWVIVPSPSLGGQMQLVDVEAVNCPEVKPKPGVKPKPNKKEEEDQDYTQEEGKNDEDQEWEATNLWAHTRLI